MLTGTVVGLGFIGWLAYSWHMTGTPLAYRPPGSVLKGGHRAPTTGDYEPWRPE